MFENFRKKILFTTSLAIGAVLIDYNRVFAQQDALGTIGQTTGLGSDLIQIIGNLIRFGLSLLGVILLLLVIYAGYLWMTAGGQEEQITKAKNIITRAVVGLLIIMASFAITTFIMSTLRDAILGGDRDGVGPTAPPLSNSLGNGGILDHYPTRNQRGVPRNTKIIVQFREPIAPSQFVEGGGYDLGGTPSDPSDDFYGTGENRVQVINAVTGEFNTNTRLPLNTNLVRIYANSKGESERLTSGQVSFVFTPDLRTYVFLVPLLGSAAQPTDYTVFIGGALRAINNSAPIDNRGYRWSFQVSTEIDLTPPKVLNVVPSAGGVFARNTVVQITFSEPMDPTSVSGLTERGFKNIEVVDEKTGLQKGTYKISNGFRTVTFVTDDKCGVNACGETIFCLAANGQFKAKVVSPNPASADSPQVSPTPYPPLGATDVSGNALDGKNNGVIRGQNNNYEWNFSTNNKIELAGPVISKILPEIKTSNVALDQPVELIFGNAPTDRIDSSTVISGNILFRPSPFHELWFVPRLRITGVVESDIVHTVAVDHGVLLASSAERTYVYDILANQGLRNTLQNCFIPATGPALGGGVCTPNIDKPYCCDGKESETACIPISQ
jgi:hypothetical protein